MLKKPDDPYFVKNPEWDERPTTRRIEKRLCSISGERRAHDRSEDSSVRSLQSHLDSDTRRDER